MSDCRDLEATLSSGFLIPPFPRYERMASVTSACTRVVASDGLFSWKANFCVEVGWFCTALGVGNAAEDLSFELATHYLRSLAVRRTASLECQQAWGRFFDDHSHVIRDVLALNGVSKRDVDDCAQNVWVKVLIHLRDENCSPCYRRFSSWLRCVVRSEVADYFRARLRRPGMLGQPCIAECSSTRECGPLDACIIDERRSIIRESLARLHSCTSNVTYQVLWMRSIQEEEVADIASQLGISCEQVWYRQYRARRALRGILLERLRYEYDGVKC